MSPRPYRLGQRQASTEMTRMRILRAAQELLTSTDGFAGFSMDAVARQADVARMTVYHQFGSKTGLLEAICDALAMSGGMEQLASVFQQGDPLDALEQYAVVCSQFWDADRLLTRRLRALTTLDPDFAQVMQARNERRRTGLTVLVQRIVAARKQHLTPPEISEIINMLYTLIGFEFFDTLAGPTRSMQEVTPIVQQLVHATLDLHK